MFTNVEGIRRTSPDCRRLSVFNRSVSHFSCPIPRRLRANPNRFWLAARLLAVECLRYWKNFHLNLQRLEGEIFNRGTLNGAPYNHGATTVPRGGSRTLATRTLSALSSVVTLGSAYTQGVTTIVRGLISLHIVQFSSVDRRVETVFQ